MKLAIGTVQFGLSYGIANTKGQPSEDIVKEILQYAKKMGINTLDTAIGYGNSENCLGNVGVSGWRVITKIPEVPNGCKDVVTWVCEQFNCSLKRLGLSRVTGVMLHRPVQLLEPIGIELWSALQGLKGEGLVDKVGYSIYDPTELDQLFSIYRPDIIQAPYNILDQRLKISGWLDKLYSNGVETHIRSVFLQGLLLMRKETRPIKFNRWHTLWEFWDQWLEQQGLNPIETCLGFVAAEEKIDFIVVGVDSLEQLVQTVSYLSIQPRQEILPDFGTTDENLINPSNWSHL